MSEKVTKSEGDGNHPSSNYLVVEDEQSPSTWHLRVKDKDGNPDHGLMGAAWAALHSGYHGNKYEGPNKEEAIKKLTGMYNSEKMDTPSAEASRIVHTASLKLHKQLEAALEAQGISLETLRQNVCSAASDLAMFKTDADKPYSPWVRDILAPESGDTWCAVIGGPDGKMYEVDFTVDDGKPTISGTPREVVQEVTYVTASMEQPRKSSGKYHGAAAATAEAYDASARAKTSDGHKLAAVLHDKAADLNKEAGDDAMAKKHKEKATDHRETAAAMEDCPPGEASAPTKSKHRFESALMVEAPETASGWNEFMAMAGGVRTVTLGCDGFPVTITLDVNKEGAQALEAQRQAIVRNSKQKPFNCFDHGGSRGKTEASSWPKRFFWKDGAHPGIYEAADPSDTGLAAIKGKRYRGFSLTFFTDAEITSLPKRGGYEIKAGAVGSPGNPAHIICPGDVEENPEDYLNMGTLTNKPAVVDNEPLFAAQPDQRISPSASAAGSAAGAPTKTSTNKNRMDTKQLDAAALQARITELEQEISGYQGKEDALSKAELRASQSELGARQAELTAAKQNERIAAFELAEKKRLGEQADKVIALGLEASIVDAELGISKLDAKAKDEWREKFIANPELMPSYEKLWGAVARTGGRLTPSANGLEAARKGGTILDYGSGWNCPEAMKRLAQFISENTSIKLHQGMSKLQLLAAYEEKGKLAMQAGLFFRKELAPKTKDWEDIPFPEIARFCKMEASLAPKPRQLEASDYTDPAGNLGTLSGTLVLQRTLPIFAFDYPELLSMYTDFSDTPGLFEQTEATRIIQNLAVQKYDTATDAAGRPKGWDTVSPAVSVDADLTLTDYIAVPIVFGQNILSTTPRKLFDEFAKMAIKAIAGYFTNMMAKLITVANFNAYVAVTAPDAFNVIKVPTAYTNYARGLSDFAIIDLDKLSAIFTQNQVPKDDRGILLNPLYYAKLRNDARLEFYFAAAKEDPTLLNQQLPKQLSGFKPYEAPYLPGTNNLAFFPYQKSAIMLKSRLPTDFTQALGVMIPGSMTTVTDPDTKISLALVQYVNLTQNFAEWRPEVQLGASIGDNRAGLVGTTQ